MIRNEKRINRPFVSVIVPNYNHARYLEQRLFSVFNQTYRSFEVIFLDDCSTDNSLEIVEQYKNNPHLSQIVVNSVNSGSAFKQWNKGIMLAKGELIWIAESDDYCELNLLEELVSAFLHQKNSALAYNPTLMRDDEGKFWNRIYVGKNQYLSGKKYLKRYLSLYNFVLNASCALFSREKAIKVSQDYQSLKGAGDYLFWVELVNQGNVAIVNKQLSYFCLHSGSVTNRRGPDGTNQREDMLVLNHIKSLVSISPFRNYYIYAYHAYLIRGYEYLSSDIKKEIWDLWKVERYCSNYAMFLLKVGRHLIKHYNYYV